MQRFRRKSDARPPSTRSPGRDSDLTPRPTSIRGPHLDSLPQLPGQNDFRASLILPSLTRRFTLLRGSNGDPVSLEDMRSRLAEQRAKGAEYSISEEEEHLIMDQLSDIRVANSRSPQLDRRPSDLLSHDGSSYYPESDYSTPISPSASPSPQAQTSSSALNRRAKRHSNNLFSSSYMSDGAYLRKAYRGGSGRSQLTDVTDVPSEDYLALSPDDTQDSIHAQDIPLSFAGKAYYLDDPSPPTTAEYFSDKTPTAKHIPLMPTSPPPGHARRVSNPEFKRISLALANVMKEIEEEGMLESDHFPSGSVQGSASSSRSSLSRDDQVTVSNRRQNRKRFSGSRKTDSSLSDANEDQRPRSPYGRQGATSPRIEGYIPGMPRPVTPVALKEIGSDDRSRPRSTTPRATSPIDHPHKNSSVPQSILRRGPKTGSIRALPRSDSPIFSSPKKANVELGEPLSSFNLGPSLHDRRRPTSPLYSLGEDTSSFSGHASTSLGGSSVLSSSDKHSRQSSFASSKEFYGLHDRSGSISTTRSLASPALPDSPFLDSAQGNIFTEMQDTVVQPQPVSPIVLDSPFLPARSPRSPTPTYAYPKAGAPSGPSEIDYQTLNSHRRSPKAQMINGHSSNPNPAPVGRGLVLSPMLNSSQSSLLSTGSSYHSSMDSSRQACEAALNILKSSSSSSGLSSDPKTPEWEAEPDFDFEKEFQEALELFGLKSEHLAAMQDLLTQATSPNLPLISRTPTLRRRKDSISSRALNASPTPQDSTTRANALLDSVLNSINSSENTTADVPALPGPSLADAEAAMDSYIDLGGGHRSASALASLADALFGPQDGHEEMKTSPREMSEAELPQTPPQTTMDDSLLPDPASSKSESASFLDTSGSDGSLDYGTVPEAKQHDHSVFSKQLTEASDSPLEQSQPLPPPPNKTDSPSYSSSPFSPPRSAGFSTPDRSDVQAQLDADSRSPSSMARAPVDHAQLILAVQRKAEEATAALKSPSQSNLPEAASLARRKTKGRVGIGQISSPQLVSSSSNINTYTIYSPSESQVNITPPSELDRSPYGSKQNIGMLQKLRGSRKDLLNPTGQEVTPWTHESPSQSSIDQPQSSQYSQSPSRSGSRNAVIYEDNYTPNNQSATSITSPNALSRSTGSIRGFLGRFRKSRRESDIVASPSAARTPPTSGSKGASLQRGLSYGSSQLLSGNRANATSPISPGGRNQQLSAPAFVQTFAETQNPPRRTIQDPIPEDEEVKKLFAAASNLGLDQAELSQLLSRSTSTSSKSAWGTQASSMSRSASLATRNTTLPGSHPGSSGSSKERSRSPDDDLTVTVKRSKSAGGRKPSIRRDAEPARRRQETPKPDGKSQVDSSIVRRTLIFPSETKDGQAIAELEGLMRKASTRSAKSVASVKSVHDRTPTPPPSRMKRFSTDKSSPPVPRVSGSSTLTANPYPSSPSTKGFPSQPSTRVNTAYESLYEMYSDGPGYGPPAIVVEDDPTPPQRDDPAGETRPALQVLEMSNGETLWSIVNDLRESEDPDADEADIPRQSFSSDRSLSPSQSQTQSRDSNVDIQLMFKEHRRVSPRGPGSSTNYQTAALRNSRRTLEQRPDTKVFYSSSNQIERLIDSLSQGLDSGSFNIVPVSSGRPSAGPSVRVSSERPRAEGGSTPASLRSEMSVDAQLERMLGSLEAAKSHVEATG